MSHSAFRARRQRTRIAGFHACLCVGTNAAIYLFMKTSKRNAARLADALRQYEGACIDFNECPHEGNRAAVQKAKKEVEELGGEA